MSENILRFRKSFYKGFTFEKMDDVAEHYLLGNDWDVSNSEEERKKIVSNFITDKKPNFETDEGIEFILGVNDSEDYFERENSKFDLKSFVTKNFKDLSNHNFIVLVEFSHSIKEIKLDDCGKVDTIKINELSSNGHINSAEYENKNAEKVKISLLEHLNEENLEGMNIKLFKQENGQLVSADKLLGEYYLIHFKGNKEINESVFRKLWTSETIENSEFDENQYRKYIFEHKNIHSINIDKSYFEYMSLDELKILSRNHNLSPEMTKDLFLKATGLFRSDEQDDKKASVRMWCNLLENPQIVDVRGDLWDDVDDIFKYFLIEAKNAPHFHLAIAKNPNCLFEHLEYIIDNFDFSEAYEKVIEAAILNDKYQPTIKVIDDMISSNDELMIKKGKLIRDTKYPNEIKLLPDTGAPEKLLDVFSLADLIDFTDGLNDDSLEEWFKEYRYEDDEAVPQGDEYYDGSIIKQILFPSGLKKSVEIEINGKTYDAEKSEKIKSMKDFDVLIEGEVHWSKGLWKTFTCDFNDDISFDKTKLSATGKLGVITDYFYDGNTLEKSDDHELEDGYTSLDVSVYLNGDIHELIIEELRSELEKAKKDSKDLDSIKEIIISNVVRKKYFDGKGEQGIVDEGLAIINQMLPKISTLSMAGCHMESLDISKFSELKSLDLSHCDSLKVIKGLSNLKKLKYLDLSFTRSLKDIDKSAFKDINTIIGLRDIYGMVIDEKIERIYWEYLDEYLDNEFQQILVNNNETIEDYLGSNINVVIEESDFYDNSFNTNRYFFKPLENYLSNEQMKALPVVAEDEVSVFLFHDGWDFITSFSRHKDDFKEKISKDIYDLCPFNMDYEENDHIEACREGTLFIEKAKAGEDSFEVEFASFGDARCFYKYIWDGKKLTQIIVENGDLFTDEEIDDGLDDSNWNEAIEHEYFPDVVEKAIEDGDCETNILFEK